NGNPVDEEAKVERLRGSGIVWELPSDGKAVREVALRKFGRQSVGRLEERQPDFDAVVVDAVAEDVHRAAIVELLREPVGELMAGPIDPAVNGDESLPGLRLGFSDEGEELGGVEAANAVEVGHPLGACAVLADPISAPLD